MERDYRRQSKRSHQVVAIVPDGTCARNVVESRTKLLWNDALQVQTFGAWLKLYESTPAPFGLYSAALIVASVSDENTTHNQRVFPTSSHSEVLPYSRFPEVSGWRNKSKMDCTTTETLSCGSRVGTKCQDADDGATAVR